MLVNLSLDQLNRENQRILIRDGDPIYIRPKLGSGEFIEDIDINKYNSSTHGQCVTSVLRPIGSRADSTIPFLFTSSPDQLNEDEVNNSIYFSENPSWSDTFITQQLSSLVSSATKSHDNRDLAEFSSHVEYLSESCRYCILLSKKWSGVVNRWSLPILSPFYSAFHNLYNPQSMSGTQFEYLIFVKASNIAYVCMRNGYYEDCAGFLSLLIRISNRTTDQKMSNRCLSEVDNQLSSAEPYMKNLVLFYIESDHYADPVSMTQY